MDDPNVIHNLRHIFEQNATHQVKSALQHDGSDKDGTNSGSSPTTISSKLHKPYMTPDDLRRLCSQLDIPEPESGLIFADLDMNQDGMLSLEEFVRGFADCALINESETSKAGNLDPDLGAINASMDSGSDSTLSRIAKRGSIINQKNQSKIDSDDSKSENTEWKYLGPGAAQSYICFPLSTSQLKYVNQNSTVQNGSIDSGLELNSHKSDSSEDSQGFLDANKNTSIKTITERSLLGELDFDEPHSEKTEHLLNMKECNTLSVCKKSKANSRENNSFENRESSVMPKSFVDHPRNNSAYVSKTIKEQLLDTVNFATASKLKQHTGTNQKDGGQQKDKSGAIFGSASNSPNRDHQLAITDQIGSEQFNRSSPFDGPTFADTQRALSNGSMNSDEKGAIPESLDTSERSLWDSFSETLAHAVMRINKSGSRSSSSGPVKPKRNVCNGLNGNGNAERQRKDQPNNCDDVESDNMSTYDMTQIVHKRNTVKVDVIDSSIIQQRALFDGELYLDPNELLQEENNSNSTREFGVVGQHEKQRPELHQKGFNRIDAEEQHVSIAPLPSPRQYNIDRKSLPRSLSLVAEGGRLSDDLQISPNDILSSKSESSTNAENNYIAKSAKISTDGNTKGNNPINNNSVYLASSANADESQVSLPENVELSSNVDLLTRPELLNLIRECSKLEDNPDDPGEIPCNQIKQVLRQLVQNIATVQQENARLYSIWTNGSEWKVPETQAESRRKYAQNLATQIDTLQSYMNLLATIKQAINKNGINGSNSSDITAKETDSKEEHKLSRKLSQILADSEAVVSRLEQIKQQLGSNFAEQGQNRDENLKNVKDLQAELKVRQKGSEQMQEELQFLKEITKALEHSRIIMQFHKLFDNHLVGDSNGSQMMTSHSTASHSPWFQRRTSFLSENNLIKPDLGLHNGLDNNSGNKNEKNFQNNATPSPPNSHEKSAQFWKDLIEKAQMIVNNDENNAPNEDSTSQRKVSILSRRVLFQEPEEIVKKKKNSKKADNVGKKLKNLRASKKGKCERVEGIMTDGKEYASNNSTDPAVPLGSSSPHQLKIIFVGDAMVGKSSFIFRAVNGFAPDKMTSTIGIDFQTKMVQLGEERRPCEVQLWDTAGQERFRSLTMNYFRKADAICLMYDVTRENTYANVRYWVNSILDATENHSLPIMIVANKIDLRDASNLEPLVRKHVTTRDGERLVQQLEMGPSVCFVETSAATGENVDSIVEELAKMAVWSGYRDSGVDGNSRIVLKDGKKANHKSKCCS